MEKKENESVEKKYRGWKAMPYVIGNETFEKLGTTGTLSNLLVYLTTVFNMKSVNATVLVNVFSGTTNLAPIFGAFLADTYFGRYITLGFASVASLMGMFIIMLTAAISKLHPHHCNKGESCASPTLPQLSMLLASFGFLVIGAGGIRPCNLAFGADQFDPQTDSGKKGINSFFNWYYFTFTFAMIISSTIIIYVQTDVSWALGFAIPTVLMFFSCAFFFVGSRVYVKVKPEGSPLTSIVQVLVAAFRKRRLRLPDDDMKISSLYNPAPVSNLITRLPHTEQFRFLEKAAIITDDIKSSDSTTIDHQRLCSLQQVEEVKCLLRVIPIWSTGILYFAGLTQISSYIVFQALQSDRHLGNSNFEIPAGSFQVFSMIALTVWIPIYDRILVPRLRRITKKEGGITMLQRMGIGIVISVLAMVVSALVEERRRNHALHHPSGIMINSKGSAISPMSSFWLIPPLMIMGFSEAFNLIGQVEFYYKQFPENMRSFAGSLTFCSSAIGSYLSGFMVTLIHRTTGRNGRRNWLDGDLNKGRLDYFYYLLAVVGVLNFLYFIICAKWYRYKGAYGSSEIALEENKSNVGIV